MEWISWDVEALKNSGPPRPYNSSWLVCPSCGNSGIERSPKRRLSKARALSHRQVTLRCSKCGRQAVYIPQNVTQPSEKELIGS